MSEMSEMKKPWTEEEEAKILEEFAFDQDAMEKFFKSMSYQTMCCLTMIPGYGCVCCPCIWSQMLCLDDNVRDQARIHHVAVTSEEILYVRDEHRQACRWDNCVAGRMQKSVPLDRVQDVSNVAPGGMSCFVTNTLHKTAVQTAGSGGVAPELSFSGLSDPERFRSAILALKRGESIEPRGLLRADAPAPPPVNFMGAKPGKKDDGMGGARGQADESLVVPLLKSIDESLRELVSLQSRSME